MSAESLREMARTREAWRWAWIGWFIAFMAWIGLIWQGILLGRIEEQRNAFRHVVCLGAVSDSYTMPMCRAWLKDGQR